MMKREKGTATAALFNTVVRVKSASSLLMIQIRDQLSYFPDSACGQTFSNLSRAIKKLRLFRGSE